MATAYFSACDIGGVIHGMTFLGINPDEALLKFHAMHDAEYDGEGKPDPTSWEIITSSDNRYVILDAEIPNDVYVLVDATYAGVTIYSDFPIHAVHIDIDNNSTEPTMVHEEDVYPVKSLMEEDEKSLIYDAYNTVIARHEQLQVISTFHDYSVQLLNEAREVVVTHGMGDGTEGEWNAGTFGHQLEVQSNLKTGYRDYLEAYFPEYIGEDGEIHINVEDDDDTTAY